MPAFAGNGQVAVLVELLWPGTEVELPAVSLDAKPQLRQGEVDPSELPPVLGADGVLADKGRQVRAGDGLL